MSFSDLPFEVQKQEILAWVDYRLPEGFDPTLEADELMAMEARTRQDRKDEVLTAIGCRAIDVQGEIENKVAGLQADFEVAETIVAIAEKSQAANWIPDPRMSSRAALFSFAREHRENSGVVNERFRNEKPFILPVMDYKEAADWVKANKKALEEQFGKTNKRNASRGIVGLSGAWHSDRYDPGKAYKQQLIENALEGGVMQYLTDGEGNRYLEINKPYEFLVDTISILTFGSMARIGLLCVGDFMKTQNVGPLTPEAK